MSFCFVLNPFNLTRVICVNSGLELSFGIWWAHQWVFNSKQWISPEQSTGPVNPFSIHSWLLISQFLCWPSAGVLNWCEFTIVMPASHPDDILQLFLCLLAFTFGMFSGAWDSVYVLFRAKLLSFTYSQGFLLQWVSECITIHWKEKLIALRLI